MLVKFVRYAAIAQNLSQKLAGALHASCIALTFPKKCLMKMFCMPILGRSVRGHQMMIDAMLGTP